MKHQTKLSQEQQEIAAHQSQQHAGQEFASAEELLRFDAAQTTVPPEIAQRLKRSAGKDASLNSRPWWKNFLGQ